MAPSMKPHSTVVNGGESNHLEPSHAHNNNNNDEDAAFVSAMQLVTSMVSSMAVQTASELGVFDAIAGAGEGARLSGKDIVDLVCCKNPDAASMIDRVMKLLASHSVVECSVLEDAQGKKQRAYGLNSVSKFFVTDADGVSCGPIMSLIQDQIFLQSWRELKGAIKEGGIAFNRVYGMHAFEYPSLDQRFNQVFNNAMHNSTFLITNRILESYQGFDQIHKLVDVGGGLGINLKLITSKYPHIQGINFDLPHVIQHAPNYPGVHHLGGDMFESVPQGDAIFMKWILHDWSDEHCLKLLKNCYKAIPENGKVIVVDAIVPTEPNTSIATKAALQGDVLMMTQNPGGKERTQQELMDLATISGFPAINFVSNVCGFWVMEFHK
ncbi:anthranilate N-methyltransferase-like [Senna tora]|uniref:caffeate O-methyltransferase n=1 Tax=Senna tora TaxID=362788 RepID=A0A834VXQ0_9FABA|nr:anthranilate N-methyltransferase-like [Senna tora]